LVGGKVDALEIATKVLERLEGVWILFASSLCGGTCDVRFCRQ
jgi:hypothetical protein